MGRLANSIKLALPYCWSWDCRPQKREENDLASVHDLCKAVESQPARHGRQQINTNRLVVAALFFATLTGAAIAQHSDVLVAVMEDHKSEKSIHKHVLPGPNCDQLLSAFRQSKAEKKRMQLTFQDPPFSGYVVEVYCIRHDGTVRKP